MTSRPVRIALQLQPQHADYESIRSAVAEAEGIGVDVIFTWDHFFPLTGDPGGQHFECWTMLAAWAEATSRVQIGSLVSCNGYRNAQLLADMARTVDHISGGRLILGIGAGWYERDYVEYGYDFPSTGKRLENLADSLPRISSRMAALNPPPTRKIPMLIGGEGEKKTLRLVAQYADIWHGFGDAATLEFKLGILYQHCADIGRDPGEVEISTNVLGGPSPTGHPDELGPTLRKIGVSLFTVGISGPDYDFEPLRAWIAWRDQLQQN